MSRILLGVPFLLFFILTSAHNAFAESDQFPKSCLFLSEKQSSQALKNYQVQIESCQNRHSEKNDPSNQWYSIRQFHAEGRSFSLLVDPNSLKTVLVDRACLQCVSGETFNNNIYTRALLQSRAQPRRLIDDGLSHGKDNQGLYLTVDLCPSHNRFDQQIFTHEQITSRKNFPVAIAISGGWIHHHQENLLWLKKQAQEQNLDIVWVNHSLTHPYTPHVPVALNFLLETGVDFKTEVLGQEQLMIENGITPSVFFRFPGLISNEGMISQLTDWGLMALGSDAWLALGQKPQKGSIILIHGNGNEPYGVRLFTHLLEALGNVSSFRSLLQVLRE